jgi:hypothetical protein
LWRDEAWQWLVIEESHSFSDLFLGMSKGGGTGYLFPILVYLARQLWASLRVMQLVNLLMAGAATFVFARLAPFERRERALFVFGYFPFYEYAVISRSYATGALLIWLACAATQHRRPALFLGAALGLLCQTTLYGYIVAIAILCGWILDCWLRRSELAPLPLAEIAAGSLLAIAGAIAGLIQFIPAPGTVVPPWRFSWDPTHAGKVLMTPWRAFVPLPHPGLNFWNSNILDPWPRMQMIAGVVTLLVVIALLWRRKVALLTFGIGAAGLIAFSYFQFVGQLRHQSHLFILLIAALWLDGALLERGSARARLLLFLFFIHCVAGVYASWMDLVHPFSNGAAIAELIRSQRLEGDALLGHREPPAATVALYLDRPLYSPSRRIFTSHPDWSAQQRELRPSEVRCAARELSRREGRDVALIMNWQVPAWEEVEALGSRRGAIVESEDYWLYRLRHDRLAATAAVAGCE